jgi:hypothetical protein
VRGDGGMHDQRQPSWIYGPACGKAPSIPASSAASGWFCQRRAENTKDTDNFTTQAHES